MALVHPPDVGVQAGGDEEPYAVGEEEEARPGLVGEGADGHQPDDACEEDNHEQAGEGELLVEEDVVPADIEDPLWPVELHGLGTEAEGGLDIGHLKGHENAEEQHDGGPGGAEDPAGRGPGGFVEVLVPVAGDGIAHEEGAEAEGAEVEREEKEESDGCLHVVETTIRQKCSGRWARGLGDGSVELEVEQLPGGGGEAAHDHEGFVEQVHLPAMYGEAANEEADAGDEQDEGPLVAVVVAVAV